MTPHRLSTMWEKSPAELVQVLADEYGDESAYGDKGLHIVAILQAKVAEESSKRSQQLVYATWALVGVTMLVAVATVVAVLVAGS